MNREDALKIVKSQITEKRYIHTIGVMETAIELARRFQVDEKKAESAAIFHDYAKFRPANVMENIIIDQKMPQDLLKFDKELWHAPVGAYLVELEVGIKDLDILNAIKYHTSGRVNMTLLDKVLYLADYIEPGRKFPGVEEVREIATTDLDLAVIYALRNTISFLLKKQQAIYPETFHTYNSMVQKYKANRGRN
jgi:predicted HD superfamily hydrolase involved in NAD metabolism